MARHLVALQTRAVLPHRNLQEPCQTDPQGLEIYGASENAGTRGFTGSAPGEPPVPSIVFGEGHLRQLLLQHFSSTGRMPAGSWGTAKEPTGDPAPPLGAGECDAQFDCHGDILSLSLSSSAHLIALSRGVLLTFLKLRVRDAYADGSLYRATAQGAAYPRGPRAASTRLLPWHGSPGTAK